MENVRQKSALLAVLAGLALSGLMPLEVFAQATKPAPGSFPPPDFRHPDADDRAPKDPCKDAKRTFGCFEVLDQLPGFKENKNIDEIAAPEGAIINVINLIIAIVRGVIIAAGLIVVVLGGYRYMTAGGVGSKVEDAKKWILAGLGGILLAILGQVLLDTISPQFSGEITPPTELKLPDPTREADIKSKAALEKEQAELIAKQNEFLDMLERIRVNNNQLFPPDAEEFAEYREMRERFQKNKKKLDEINQRLNK